MEKKKPKEPTPPTDLTQTSPSKVNTDTTGKSWKSIRIDRPFPLPQYVREALHKLSEAGFVAYVVGGSVRDFLLGRESKDHDIATNALPEDLCRLFPQAIEVGKAFGVIKVPTGVEPPLLEIATFRQDFEYQDHRHPKRVAFSGSLQDAFRRDFTINALFYDPKTSKILDATGGVDDLKNGIIRAIGNPSERFREDALRLLRAIRFKTRLGFQLDPDTSAAILARAKLITKVSFERIRDELTMMWTGPHPGEALKLLSELGLLFYILPEVEALKGVPQIPTTHPKEDLWKHLLKMLECLAIQSPVRSSAVSWAAVLHEIGKPVVSQTNQEKSFNGHEIESSKLCEKVTARLKMANAESDRIAAMVANHLKFREVFQMRESTLLRFLRQDYFEELLALHKADATVSDGNLAFYEFCAHRFEALKNAPEEIQKLLDGKDLIHIGFHPGPEFSEILRIVEDLTLERKLTTKEEALEYVVKNFVK